MANKHASSLFTAAGNPKATQVGGIPASAVSGVGSNIPPSPPPFIGSGVLASTNVAQAQALPQPKAGPNAMELTVVSFDPDSQIVDVRLPNGIEGQVDLSDPSVKPTTFNVELFDGGKLGPRIEVRVIPAVKPPKFNSVEEAEAWMEANA